MSGQVPNVKNPNLSFTYIKQTNTESFFNFVDRLKDDIGKQVQNEEACKALLQKLAFENANADCKKALMPLTDPTVVEMIEACDKMNSVSRAMQTVAVTMASAVTTKVATTLKTSNKLFNCGKDGHFKKNCWQLRLRVGSQ